MEGEFITFASCHRCALAREKGRIGQVTKITTIIENPQPPIVLFVGEAPGRNEITANEVFVGRSGELLRSLIEEFGLSAHAMLTNAILCCPTDLVRKQKEWYKYPAVPCGEILAENISKIAPDIIVCLGSAALNQLLRKQKEVALNRKFTIEIPYTTAVGGMGKKTVTVFYTYHPAAVLHNPTQRLLSHLRSCFAAIRAEVESMKRKGGNGDELLRNIEHCLVATKHNEALIDFLTFLLDVNPAKDKSIPVVVDIEVGSVKDIENFDSKSPNSTIVLVGIGDERHYRGFVFFWVDENLRGEFTADIRDWKAFKEFLQDKRFCKVFHNSSFELLWFMRLFGVYPPPNQFLDTMCLAHSVNEFSPSFSLESLAREYGVLPSIQNWKEMLTNHNACFVETKQLGVYNRIDVMVTARLLDALRKKLREQGENIRKMTSYFHSQVFNKINIIAAHMMSAGIPVSTSAAEEIRNQLILMEMEYLRKLKEAAPAVENFNSNQQIIKFLLELGVEELYEFRTSKGNLSLSREVIDTLCERRPDIQFLHDLKVYREIQKCRSTFIEKVESWVDKHSGRIYPNIHVTGTVSGRVTTSNPPLQNFPSERKEVGKIVKKIFVPPPGYVFITCDAKQHELRVLAIKSGDPQLKDAFLSGSDVHKVNASRILNKPLEEITDEERAIGKKFSFAVVYGVTKEGAARIFNLPPDKAEELLNAMYAAFPQAIKYIETHRDKIFQPPHIVHTWLGRVSHLVAQSPQLTQRLTKERDRNDARIERLRRIAGNYVIQSEASDLWGVIVYEIFQEMEKKGWCAMSENSYPLAQICLTIHDSVILLCKEELTDEILQIIKRSLARVSKMFGTEDLPFTAEYEVYNTSLGDQPIRSGEWTVDEIKEEIKILPPVEKFMLFKD